MANEIQVALSNLLSTGKMNIQLQLNCIMMSDNNNTLWNGKDLKLIIGDFSPKKHPKGLKFYIHMYFQRFEKNQMCKELS